MNVNILDTENLRSYVIENNAERVLWELLNAYLCKNLLYKLRLTYHFNMKAVSILSDNSIYIYIYIYIIYSSRGI